jgi:hypothetical protein
MKVGQLHAAAAVPVGKESPVPKRKKVGWTPELVWTIKGETISDHLLLTKIVSEVWKFLFPLLTSVDLLYAR